MFSSSASSPSHSPRFLPLLLLLFVGSGCAALIYEIVWLQLLQLVIGSSAFSLAVLLGTFMGGMCLGSFALPRFISAQRHPLRLYALLEIGIAVSGLVVLFAMPVVGRVYTALVGHGVAGIALRALVCAICLLPPTIMMGATLPAVARWIETTPRGVSWLGYFYGGNTAGAVAGCVLAGFYLLPTYDMATATWFAVVINLLVAALALALASRAPHRKAPDEAPSETAAVQSISQPVAGSRVVLVSIALSGLCALAAEVVWARTLSLLLGATVYTFSIILAVFLVGLGLGSSAGAAIGRSRLRPRVALGLCQLLQVAGIAWAAYAIAVSLPYWPAELLPNAGRWAQFKVGIVTHQWAAVPRPLYDVVRCAFAILPSALLWGASFPLALAALAQPGLDPARLVGRTYAANTLGAIAGALGASLWLIPHFGTQHTQQILLAVSLGSAALVLFRRLAFGLPAALAGFAVIVGLAPVVSGIPWQLVAYGRQIATTDYGAKSLFLGEGMNSSVNVTENPGGARFFHVSGKTEASSIEKDMRLQRMLGHIPALLHPNPKSVLIVGCGAGVTAGSFVIHPSIERIVICDIEPLIPQVVSTFFKIENNDVVHDPRVEIVYDDARHFIATTKEHFDIITSDPIHPWVKGSAVLYSQEYFELCRQHLNPGGFVTQWVPLYESDRAVVLSEIATFFTVFPQGTIWGNDDDGSGYDTVMLGQAEPLRVDVAALTAKMARPDHARVINALVGLDLDTPVGLLSSYTGRYADLKAWLAPAEINRDRNLRLQYLAGRQLNSNEGAGTYTEMVSLRVFPQDLFYANDDTLIAPLRLKLATGPIRP